MQEIEEFVDDRQKAWCVHCGGVLAHSDVNRDHVPPRALLDRPLPTRLPQMEVCSSCNSGFSRDEEYLAVFLSCLLAGTADPEGQPNPAVGRALARRPSLRARIAASSSVGEDGAVLWQPEWERVTRVILKNARGHAVYEIGEPMLDEPEYVRAHPLKMLDPNARSAFEDVGWEVWPEVGSRTTTRVLTGQDLQDGWVVVQDGVYRYAVIQDGGVVVRSVLRDYLATETRWS